MKTIKEMIDEKEISRLNKYIASKERLLSLCCFSADDKNKIKRDIQHYKNCIADLERR